jgi:N-formylglutamate amidohydrolase
MAATAADRVYAAADRNADAGVRGRLGPMSDAVFVLEEGDGPIVATAIHAGHALHPEIAALIALDEAIRMHEEDPFTAQLARVAPTRLIALREVDLNRPRERAVYRGPADAWGPRGVAAAAAR